MDIANVSLKWDEMGLPAFCDGAAYVLDLRVSRRSHSLQHPTINYTYDEANYTRDHPAADLSGGGTLSQAACVRMLPRTSSSCTEPPFNCSRWPGCNYSAWDGCETLAAGSASCLEELAISYQRHNVTAGTWQWATEIVNSPARAEARRCSPDMLASGNVTCNLTVTAQYDTTVREFVGMPVYSAEVCHRYKKQCSLCFCIDTIPNFWVVWFFSLSAGYSALCSPQFSTILQEYSLFVGAAVSVTLVNMLLKMLLRSFAGFEKRHTKSDTEKSIAVKIFIAQFFNTALVPLLVYAKIESLSATVCRNGNKGEYDPANAEATFGFNGMPCQLSQGGAGESVCSLGGGECRAVIPNSMPIFRGEFVDFESLWYSTVGTSILITVMVNTVMTLLPLVVEWPLQIISEKVAASTSVTQRQLNRVFEGPDFELAARYGVILNNIFSCMLYSAGSPVFYLVAAATCAFTYMADKISLHYLYKTPTRYNGKLAVFTVNVLPAAAVLHMAFAVWKYSSVMAFMPVSESITSSVASAITKSCLARSQSDPLVCEWACAKDANEECAFIVNSTLHVNHTMCEHKGLGECHGADPSLLAFNFGARLFSW